eukprot:CAMPEP_0117676364 /NCGR_PEP_ID=MMETSP0804-20121206/16128_1 /TAXON_ID=1074897 /ORGANISM="Tetraselmis astigmatica, Strain CCMP880" /LENGTH=303 /DNA_ID=CAMNT_0005485487 /DNA_START=207 /DNA_END=1118 /DNA_ORIENTATION=+
MPGHGNSSVCTGCELAMDYFVVHSQSCGGPPIRSIQDCVWKEVCKRMPASGILRGPSYPFTSEAFAKQLKYKVRLALLDLDNPPSWFQSQGADHLSAQEAREFANSSGPVKLLTNPKAAGYIQNPISVYYCYLEGSRLDKCIAEVTNTPWGDRVRFIFNPRGEDVPKSLHVSPFMDMRATWHLVAPAPLDHLSLTVLAQRHPKFGDFFDAHLVARRVSGPTSGLRNEEAQLDDSAQVWVHAPEDGMSDILAGSKAVVEGCHFLHPPYEGSAGEAAGEGPDKPSTEQPGLPIPMGGRTGVPVAD